LQEKLIHINIGHGSYTKLTMKITFTKNAKHFVLAVKAIGGVAKRFVLRVSRENGITISVMSEDRTGYHILRIPLSEKDMVVSGQHTVAIALESKQFIQSLRTITTLSDAVILCFNDDRTLDVTTKTKQEETTTKIQPMSMEEQLLGVPETLPVVYSGEFATKDIDDAMKKCGNYVVFETEPEGLVVRGFQRTPENYSQLPYQAKAPGPQALVKQCYQTALLNHYVKPTLAKKCTVTISEGYPVRFVYKLYKDSSLTMFLAECSR
jgi:hypothetical protein